MLELTPVTEGSEIPPKDAPFEEKLAYYRSQHTTRGIRATHLVGIPTVMVSVPLILGRPKVGLGLFAAGWALQIFGHRYFEKNSPALTKGFVTYQMCGLAFWAEEVADIVAGRSDLIGGNAEDIDFEVAGSGIPVGTSASV